MREFTYGTTADRRVLISWRGRIVTTLAGAKAARFLVEADGVGGEAEQLLLARATGNFKRGNER